MAKCDWTREPAITPPATFVLTLSQREACAVWAALDTPGTCASDDAISVVIALEDAIDAANGV